MTQLSAKDKERVFRGLFSHPYLLRQIFLKLLMEEMADAAHQPEYLSLVHGIQPGN